MVKDDDVSNYRDDFIKAAFKDKNVFKANVIAETIINLHKKNKNVNIYEYCVDMYNIANFYQNTGNLMKSSNIHKDNIKFFTNTDYFKQNNYSKEFATIFVDIYTLNGVCLYKLNEPHASLRSFEKSHQIASDYLQGTEKYLNCLHNLGCAYFNLENYEKAIEIHLKSLENRKNKDIDYADTLNFLGYSYEEQENYEKALYYFNKSITIIKGLEGISSSDYLANIFYLASVYEKAEKYEESITYFEKALNLVEKKFGESSSYISETLNKIADIYIKLKEEEKAIKITLKSLKLIRSSYGENHIFYANTIKKLADIYYSIKDYNNALIYYERESEIKKKIIGKDSSLYIDTLLNLVNINLKLNNAKKVSELCDEIFNLSELNIKDEIYEKALLLLGKIFSTEENSNGLFKVYENFKKIDPMLSFDEMLKNISKTKDKVAKDVYFSNEKNTEKHEVERKILKDLRNFLEKSIGTLKGSLASEIEKESTLELENLVDEILGNIENNPKVTEDKIPENPKETPKISPFDENNYTQESILDLFSYKDEDNQEPLI